MSTFGPPDEKGSERALGTRDIVVPVHWHAPVFTRVHRHTRLPVSPSLWWNVRGPASGPALACERVVGLSDMNNTADSTALAPDYAERCTERAIP